jgi:arabinose-5-phosphate isomerase
MDTLVTPKSVHLSTTASFCEMGRAVIETEANAVRQLIERINPTFAQACEILIACTGRIVVTGMGKSGHIGSKIAATLASTGSPAFYMHPGEANHGDMGMITRNDVVLAISNSGDTEEIVSLLPLIKRLEVPLISLTGKPNSPIAQSATVNIDVSVEKEACPLGLAPTASTTATLAMGDALAIALLQSRGFTAEDFALSHPGGLLGRKLLLRVKDVMHTGTSMPRVTPEVSVMDALMEASKHGFGMTAIVSPANEVLGIFTDGDLRRALNNEIDLKSTAINHVMTTNCITVTPDMLAVETVKLMEQKKINSFLVVDHDKKLVGVLNMHDLLRARVM